MKPSIHFEPPEGKAAARRRRAARTGAKAARRGHKARLGWPTPLSLACLLSLLWLAALGFAGWHLGWTVPLGDPAALGGIAALAIAPLLPLWLYAAGATRQGLFAEEKELVRADLTRMLAPVEAAEARVKLMTERFRAGIDQLEMAAEGAADRVGRLETHFKDEVVSLFAATADADARAVTLRESLKREVVSLDELSKTLTGRLETLREQFETLASAVEKGSRTAVERTEQGTAALDAGRRRLADTVDGIEGRLDGLAGRLDEVGRTSQGLIDALEQQTADSAGRLQDRMDRLEGQSETLSQIAETLAKDLEARAAGLARAAQDTTRSAGTLETVFQEQGGSLSREAEAAVKRASESAEAIQQHLAAARRAAEATMAHARGEIDSLSQMLDARLGAVPGRFDSAVEAAMAPLMDAQKLLEAQLDSLTERFGETSGRLTGQIAALADGGARASGQLGEMADSLAARTDALGERGRIAAARLETAGSVIDQRADRLGAVQERLAGGFAALAGELEARQAQLADLMARIEADYRAHGERSDRALAQLAAAEGTLGQQQVALQRIADAAAGSLERKRQALADARAGLQQELVASREGLAGLIEDLTGRQAQLGKAAEAQASRLLVAGQQLEDGTSRLDDRRRVLEERLVASTTALAEQSRGLAGATERLVAEADAVAEEMQERLTRTVQRGIEASNLALERLTDVYRSRFARLSADTSERFSAAVDALGQALISAEQAGDRLNDRLRQDAEQILTTAESLDERMAALQSASITSTRAVFLESATKILDRLASDSIDVTKALADDIPDDAWSRFLEGDKSRFARQVARLGSQELRSRIKERYRQDEDFRDASARFMADFDQLMGEAIARDGRNALAVTLISSELGRLYVALTQTLRKAN